MLGESRLNITRNTEFRRTTEKTIADVIQDKRSKWFGQLYQPHLFAITGRQKRGPGTLQTRD